MHTPPLQNFSQVITMRIRLQGFIVLFSGAMAYVIAPRVARLLFGRVKAHQGAAHG